MKFKIIISTIFFLLTEPGILLSSVSRITDLAVNSSGFRHVAFQWTAPSGPNGPPIWYYIRVSSYRVIVNETNWNNNSTSSSHPYRIRFSTPTPSGNLVIRVISSLVNNQTYFFAVKSSTDNINWSALDTSILEPQSMPQNSSPGNVGGYNHTGSPTPVVFSSSVFLTWTAVTNSGGWPPSTDNIYGDSVVSYTLWYSTASNFSVRSVVENLTQTNFITPPLNENTTYWWRVYARDSEGLLSPSVVGSPQFVVNATSEPPSTFGLITPIDDAIITHTLTPVLWWQSSNDVDPYDFVRYDIFISTSMQFELSVSTVATNLNTTNWTLQWNLIENARYYWKVYARDTTGRRTPSSSTGTFRLNTANEPPQAFSLTSPINGSMILTSSPTLVWQAAIDLDPGNTVYYGISYSSITNNPHAPVIFNTTTTYHQISNLEEDSVYWWRVVARSIPDNLTTLSSISSFTVNAINSPPSNFSLITSSGLIRTQTPQLSWSVSSDPDGDTVRYEIYYSSRADFSVAISSRGITGTTFAVSPALNENTTYWWFVSANDGHGGLRHSPTWHMVIDAVHEPPLPFDPISPANGSILNTLVPEFIWELTIDPDYSDSVHYELWYSTRSDFLTKEKISFLATSAHKISDANELVRGSTYWNVFAIDRSTQSTQSVVWTFSIPFAAPLAPVLLKAEINVSDVEVELSWQAPVKNTDDTPAELKGYYIFKAHSIEDLLNTKYHVFVSTSQLNWKDSVASADTYYLVKAISVLDVISGPSNIIKVSENQNINIIISADTVMRVEGNEEILRTDYLVLFSKKENPEADTKTKLYYLIEASDASGNKITSSFAEPLTLSFEMDALTNLPTSELNSESYSVFWNNGVEWINLGGRMDGRRIVVKTNHLGEFKVREVKRAAEFKVLNAWPKVLTPDSNGINDEFNIMFENPYPESITGEIFDLSGYKVAEMEKRSGSWVIWNGNDLSGGKLPTGIYIYQLRVGNKVKNGTVVVAR